MIVAFGHIDKALFLEACQALWQETFERKVDDGRDEPFVVDDVDHDMAAIVSEHRCPACKCDDFALSWAEGANRNVPITVLSEIEA
jgi:hypothetical protein